jgi:hypothetical protein
MTIGTVLVARLPPATCDFSDATNIPDNLF